MKKLLFIIPVIALTTIGCSKSDEPSTSTANSTPAPVAPVEQPEATVKEQAVEKVEEVKEAAAEQVEAAKEQAEDKLEDVKEQATDKVEELKDGAADKLNDFKDKY